MFFQDVKCFTAAGFLVSLLVGCGQAQSPQQQNSSANPQDLVQEAQSESLLNTESGVLTGFLKWTPVLPGDKAFVSQGHGGITVHSYLNPLAAKHVLKSVADGTPTYPMPQGSRLAKAVVPDAATPASKASRVYFMRKEAPGFDPQNGDWSYALANRRGSKLVFDPSVPPKAEGCISCHVKFKQFDNVMTVEFFKKGTTEL
jgi:hypothetical protein